MEIENIRAEVFEQYEEIRKSGLLNMFDRDRVKQLADDWGFDDLVESIEGGNYSRILKNYSKAVELGIIVKKKNGI